MESSTQVSPRLSELRNEWPRTCKELECTFWLGADAGVSRDHKFNDCGYVLWGLRRMEAAVSSQHGAHEYTRAEVDRAAAGEVRYHWTKGTQFRRPAAALTACWAALVRERPEKLEAGRKAQGGGVKRSGSAGRLGDLLPALERKGAGGAKVAAV
jgi:hypothetical protein